MFAGVFQKRHIPAWTAMIAACSLVSILIMLHAILPDQEEDTANMLEKKWERIRFMEKKMEDMKQNVAKADAYKAELIEMAKSCNVSVSQAGDGCRILLAADLPQLEVLSKDVLGPELDNTDLLGCRHIDSIQINKQISKGFSKVVHSAWHGETEVAVKSAALEVRSVQDCLKRRMFKKKEDCYILANYEVIREGLLLRQVHHSGIPKLLGMCVRSESSSTDIKERGVSLVVEMGKQLDLAELISLPWQQRIQISMNLGSLLFYLAHSPLGSLKIKNFEVDRFILVGNRIKLADVNELTSMEPECSADYKCPMNGIETDNIRCFDYRCIGMNEQFNLQAATQVFFKPLLHVQSSEPIAQTINQLIQDITDLKMTSDHVFLQLKSLYRRNDRTQRSS